MSKAATRRERLTRRGPHRPPAATGTTGEGARPTAGESPALRLRMLLIPCSCGVTFSVSEEYDRKGMHLRSFIPCPGCGKRHDPRNRLLSLGYHDEHFWKVDGC